MKQFLRYSFVALLAMVFGNVYADDVTDVLTWEGLGLDGTSSSYVAFSDKKITSDAIYAGTASSGQGKYIQLRTKNSNEGIVTTTSGGKLKTIKITFNEATTDRSIEIYGKNEAYASAADLFGDAKGTLLATIAANAESKTLNVEGDYTFIGLKSANSAIYVDKIEITWTTAGGGGSDPTPSGNFYAWEDGMEAANKLTFADGSTVQITGNETKTISSAKKITIDGNEYTTLKISNGAENTFTLPAGKKAKSVTFYSYVNKATADAADRDNYWADVNGTAYDAAAKGTMKDFTDSEDYLLHPDVYTFELGGVNSFTFKNAGYQPCIVIRVALDDPANISTVKTAVIDGTRYNLAGQKVDKSYKGVVIMNGKKMVQK